MTIPEFIYVAVVSGTWRASSLPEDSNKLQSDHCIDNEEDIVPTTSLDRWSSGGTTTCLRPPLHPGRLYLSDNPGQTSIRQPAEAISPEPSAEAALIREDVKQGQHCGLNPPHLPSRRTSIDGHKLFLPGTKYGCQATGIPSPTTNPKKLRFPSVA